MSTNALKIEVKNLAEDFKNILLARFKNLFTIKGGKAALDQNFGELSEKLAAAMQDAASGKKIAEQTVQKILYAFEQKMLRAQIRANVAAWDTLRDVVSLLVRFGTAVLANALVAQ